jgi:RNA polymerase sigma factor (sigma-70 family)
MHWARIPRLRKNNLGFYRFRGEIDILSSNYIMTETIQQRTGSEGVTMLKLWRTPPSHQDLFAERYDRLLASALRLTANDRSLAEDLVHDAFIQFTLGRPDVNGIENLDGYFYGMLRKLHLSQMRRDSRNRTHPHFLVEYDSAEASLRVVDPRNGIQAQEELRRICQYACARKETAKAGSVLIMRFFLGYYSSEIAKVLRSSRHAVDLRLRIARSEAKAALEAPHALVFLGSAPPVERARQRTGTPGGDFLGELQNTIFGSRRGECLPFERLEELYSTRPATPIKCETLAHIATCRPCLDLVNRLLCLPLLSQRFPMDTLGKDTGPKDGPGGAGGGASGLGGKLSKCLRRAREAFEQRPLELHISVNGLIQASQTINSELTEQTLDIDMAEQIGFVEVFSEQETRLLFLNVEPPPAGPFEQVARVELSDNRALELTLKFGGPWPTLHTVYYDPLVPGERAVAAFESEAEIDAAFTEEKAETQGYPLPELSGSGKPPRSPVPTVKTNPRAPLQMIRDFMAFILRPAPVTAIFAVTLIAAFLLLRNPRPVPTMEPASLLRKSVEAEEGASASAGLALHRTVIVEEQRIDPGRTSGVTARGSRSEASDKTPSVNAPAPGAEPPVIRRRVEVWQTGSNGASARRAYDERSRLVAGEWRKPDGERLVYDRGVKPKVQPAPRQPGSAISLAFDDIWLIDPSARNFTELIGRPSDLHIVERPDAYYLNYESPRPETHPAAPLLIRASLVLNRSDLHAVRQTLVVRQSSDEREYRFVETVFERRASDSVAPAVFEPDNELLGKTKAKSEGLPAVGGLTPPATIHPVASAELEVEALRLLSQIGADLGQEVTVKREIDGLLKIEGIVETEKRKSEVLSVLTSVAGDAAVKLKIETWAETERRARSGRATSESSVAAQSGAGHTVAVDLGNDSIPIGAELRGLLLARGVPRERLDEDVRRLAGKAIDRSNRARLQAWALRNLANRFSKEDLGRLDPRARAKWMSMIAEHAAAFRSETRKLREDVAPIFNISATAPEGEGPLAEEGDLANAIERLVMLASATDSGVQSSFSISTGVKSSTVVQTQEFWQSVISSEQLAARIQAAAKSVRNGDW